LKKTNIPLDVLIISFCIVALILWLCKETINIYAAHFANLTLLAAMLILVYGGLVGLHRLAMMRLEYLKEKSSQRFTATLNAGQSLVVIDGDTQTLVTAPTAKQLPTVEAVAALPAPVEKTLAKLLDFEELIKCAAHYFVNGATGDGKSTIVIELMNYIRVPYPMAEVMLIDPKNSPDWTIPAQIKSIDNVMDGINKIYSILKKRVKNQDVDAEPIILIVDEHDWIKEEYGVPYISTLRKIFKVGRQYNVHLILIGQSPLSKDNGLSGADMLNFGRVILGSTIAKYLRYGLDYPELKDPMRLEYKNLISEGRRACVVVPAKHLPFVAEVPEIKHNRPTFRIEPILVENWPIRSNLKQLPDGRTDGRLEVIRQLIDEKGDKLSRDDVRKALSERGFKFSNSDYQSLIREARGE